jgi:transcription antitermination factor NusG
MSWYIAITNPNCHRRAENGLASRGYAAFWPKCRKWASHARVKVAKEYPILGRYLFVNIPDANFWAVRAVDGIEALLTGDDGAPAPVHEQIIWDFRERYLNGEWDFVRESRPVHEWNAKKQRYVIARWEDNERLPVGAKVKVMEGEFAGMITVIRGHRNNKVKFLPPGKHQFVFTREANVRAA